MRNDTIYHGKVLSFREDKRVEIHMDALLLYSGTWKAGNNRVCVSICKLEVEPRNYEFSGSIAVCGDQLLLRDGFVDGFNSFYEKR